MHFWNDSTCSLACFSSKQKAGETKTDSQTETYHRRKVLLLPLEEKEGRTFTNLAKKIKGREKRGQKKTQLRRQKVGLRFIIFIRRRCVGFQRFWWMGQTQWGVMQQKPYRGSGWCPLSRTGWWSGCCSRWSSAESLGCSWERRSSGQPGSRSAGPGPNRTEQREDEGHPFLNQALTRPFSQSKCAQKC